jgi:hypothetical protein
VAWSTSSLKNDDLIDFILAAGGLAVARPQGLGKGGVEPPAAEFRGTLKNGLEVTCLGAAQLNS